MKTVTNYRILSFHWRVNENRWQTGNRCAVPSVQSQPASPEGTVVLIGQRRDCCWHAQKFSPGWAIHKQLRSPLPPHTWRKNHDRYLGTEEIIIIMIIIILIIIIISWGERWGETVKVGEGVVWGWSSMRWGGLNSARLSAAGKHLWCLHLPSPAERREGERFQSVNIYNWTGRMTETEV